MRPGETVGTQPRGAWPERHFAKGCVFIGTPPRFGGGSIPCGLGDQESQGVLSHGTQSRAVHLFEHMRQRRTVALSAASRTASSAGGMKSTFYRHNSRGREHLVGIINASGSLTDSISLVHDYNFCAQPGRATRSPGCYWT